MGKTTRQSDAAVLVGDAPFAHFVLELDASFERAARPGAIVKTLRLGERHVDLHFANAELTECLVPALAGLQDGPSGASADLTIAIWDSDSTRVAMPPAPWSLAAIGPRGEIRADQGPRFRAAFNVDSQTLSFADTATARCHFWTPSLKRLRGYERAAPLRTLLAWAVQAWGFQLVHAACIALGQRGVLLAGRGGSGKSTCALACLGTAWDYVADDYCVLSLSQPRPHAFGIFATAKLEPAHLAQRLPHVATRCSKVAEGDDKSILYLDATTCRVMSRPVPVDALVLPQVARDGRTWLEPCSAAAALTALAPSTVFQTPGIGRETFLFLAQVVRRLPCYSLSIGSDVDEVHRALRGLLA